MLSLEHEFGQGSTPLFGCDFLGKFEARPTNRHVLVCAAYYLDLQKRKSGSQQVSHSKLKKSWLK